MAIFITHNKYFWSDCYDTLSKYTNNNNVYKHVNDKIYIFYIKKFENIKKLNRDEIISLIKLTKLPYNIRYDNNPCNLKCDFCGYHQFQKHGSIVFNNHLFYICGLCEFTYNHEVFKIVMNTSFSYSNLERSIKVNDQIIYFYKTIVPCILYDYKQLLRHCYLLPNTLQSLNCVRCKNTNQLYYNGLCKSCYEYSYNSSGLHSLFYLSSICNKDVYSHILYFLLKTLRVHNITFMYVYTKVNK